MMKIPDDGRCYFAYTEPFRNFDQKLERRRVCIKCEKVQYKLYPDPGSGKDIFIHSDWLPHINTCDRT